MISVETLRMMGKCTLKVDSRDRILFDEMLSAPIDILNLKPSVVYGFVFYDKKVPKNMIFHLGLENKRGRVEISYGTEEEYRNQGYATEGVREAVRWLFSNTSEPEIYGLVCKSNIPSIKTLEKCGFSNKEKCGDDAYWYCISKKDAQKP